MAEVILRQPVELHPLGCACRICDPTKPHDSTVFGPAVSLWLSLADDEGSPPGWKRPGAYDPLVGYGWVLPP